MLKQDIFRKQQMDKKVIKLDTGGNSKKYQVEDIWNSGIYTNKLELGKLPGLYYLVK